MLAYDKLNNEFFANRLERVQHKTCQARTGVIQGKSRKRLYKELGLESPVIKDGFVSLLFSIK